MSQGLSSAFLASRAALSDVVLDFPVEAVKPDASLKPVVAPPPLINRLDRRGRPIPTPSTGKIEIIIYD